MAEASAADQPLILNLRAHGGGDASVAAAVAGCSVERPFVQANHLTRRSGGFEGLHDRVLKPNSTGPKFRGRVAVLVGPGVVSSCEAFVMMLKQVPRRVLVRERATDTKGNPKPASHGSSVMDYAPSRQALRPDGSCFEGEGIAPDVEGSATASELKLHNPIIEKAFELLHKTPESP